MNQREIREVNKIIRMALGLTGENLTFEQTETRNNIIRKLERLRLKHAIITKNSESNLDIECPYCYRLWENNDPYEIEECPYCGKEVMCY